jgi:hypothetical protein
MPRANKFAEGILSDAQQTIDLPSAALGIRFAKSAGKCFAKRLGPRQSSQAPVVVLGSTNMSSSTFGYEYD